MMQKTAAAVVACCVLGPGAAMADRFHVSDLGVEANTTVCLNKAERIMRRYENSLGTESVAIQNWTAYSWGMQPGDQNAVIICANSTEGGTDRVRAILVVYGKEAEADSIATREVMKGYWAAE